MLLDILDIQAQGRNQIILSLCFMCHMFCFYAFCTMAFEPENTLFIFFFTFLDFLTYIYKIVIWSFETSTVK